MRAQSLAFLALALVVLAIIGTVSATDYSIRLNSYAENSAGAMEAQGFSMPANNFCSLVSYPLISLPQGTMFNVSVYGTTSSPLNSVSSFSGSSFGDCYSLWPAGENYLTPATAMKVNSTLNITSGGNVTLQENFVCPTNIVTKSTQIVIDGSQPDAFGNVPLRMALTYRGGVVYGTDLPTLVLNGKTGGALPAYQYFNCAECGCGISPTYLTWVEGWPFVPSAPLNFYYDDSCGLGDCDCRGYALAYPLNSTSGKVNITFNATENSSFAVVSSFAGTLGYGFWVVDALNGSFTTLKYMNGAQSYNIQNVSYNWSVSLASDRKYFLIFAEAICDKWFMGVGTGINETNMLLTFDIGTNYPSSISSHFVSPFPPNYQCFGSGVGGFQFNATATAVPSSSFDSFRYELFQDNFSNSFYSHVGSGTGDFLYVDVTDVDSNNHVYYYQVTANNTYGDTSTITGSTHLVKDCFCSGGCCSGSCPSPEPSVTGGSAQYEYVQPPTGSENFTIPITQPGLPCYDYNVSCADSAGLCNASLFNITFTDVAGLCNSTVHIPVIVTPIGNASGCYNGTFIITRLNDSYAINYTVLGCYENNPGNIELVSPEDFVASLFPSQTITKTYVVNNSGTGNLTDCHAFLDGGFTGQGWWSFSEQSFSLAPGESKNLVLTIAGPPAGLYTTNAGLQVFCTTQGHFDTLLPLQRKLVAIFSIEPSQTGGGGGGGFVSATCGNKICEFIESSVSCPQDCQFSNQTFTVKQRVFSYPTLPITYQDTFPIYNPNQEKLQLEVIVTCVENDPSCDWIYFIANKTEVSGKQGITLVIDEGTESKPAYQFVTVMMKAPRDVDTNLNFRATIKVSSGKKTAIIPYELIGLPAFGPVGYLIFGFLKAMFTRIIAFPQPTIIGDGIYFGEVFAVLIIAVAAVVLNGFRSKKR